MIAPDVVAPISSVTPTSLFGWGGFIFSLIACVILLWDRVIGRGKSLAGVSGKIDGLCAQVGELETTQQVMDQHLDSLSRDVRDLTLEWRGFGGDNGFRSVIKQHTEQITAIVRRNSRIDAVREEDERRSGGQHRRIMDRVMDDKKPEDE